MTNERLLNLAYYGISERIHKCIKSFDNEWNEEECKEWEKKLEDLRRERSEIIQMYDN